MDEDNVRPHLLCAQAITADISFGRKMDIEQFMIMLQSQFADTEDKAKLLRIIGNMTDEASQNIKDDGMKQSVVVKKGAATLDEESVPNPAKLAPFRTFIEVEQPRSYYLCRVFEGLQVALYEANGGEWRNQAIAKIKTWFEENLAEEEKALIYILA